jgi:glycosyltransferase involved in cell wall biosynthesis
MTFSIIIPTYNRASIIADTINSVLHQTFSDFEVIVVDDGSSDNTRQVVETVSDHRVRYYHKKNEERSMARNFGAKQAKGRYLIFLDSDDKLNGDHLSQINDFLTRENFGPKFIFVGFSIQDEKGKIVYQYKRTGIFPAKKLLYGNYLGCSSVVIEANLFNKHLFNTLPDLIVFEDWELWLRVISEENLFCIPSCSVVMSNHGDRSVLNLSAQQLEKKGRCLISVTVQNLRVLQRSARARRRLKMGVYSYIALHAALAKEKRLFVIKFMISALFQDPVLFTKKRFYAIIKRLF